MGKYNTEEIKEAIKEWSNDKPIQSKVMAVMWLFMMLDIAAATGLLIAHVGLASKTWDSWLEAIVTGVSLALVYWYPAYYSHFKLLMAIRCGLAKCIARILNSRLYSNKSMFDTILYGDYYVISKYTVLTQSTSGYNECIMANGDCIKPEYEYSIKFYDEYNKSRTVQINEELYNKLHWVNSEEVPLIVQREDYEASRLNSSIIYEN